MIKDSQIVEHIPKNYLHITYFNIQRTLLYYWEKEERPIRSTMLILAIMDQQNTQCLFGYNAVSPNHYTRQGAILQGGNTVCVWQYVQCCVSVVLRYCAPIPQNTNCDRYLPSYWWKSIDAFAAICLCCMAYHMLCCT